MAAATAMRPLPSELDSFPEFVAEEFVVSEEFEVLDIWRRLTLPS
jgi:hypothetical protein